MIKVTRFQGDQSDETRFEREHIGDRLVSSVVEVVYNERRYPPFLFALIDMAIYIKI